MTAFVLDITGDNVAESERRNVLSYMDVTIQLPGTTIPYINWSTNNGRRTVINSHYIIHDLTCLRLLKVMLDLQ